MGWLVVQLVRILKMVELNLSEFLWVSGTRKQLYLSDFTRILREIVHPRCTPIPWCWIPYGPQMKRYSKWVWFFQLHLIWLLGEGITENHCSFTSSWWIKEYHCLDRSFKLPCFQSWLSLWNKWLETVSYVWILKTGPWSQLLKEIWYSLTQVDHKSGHVF